MNIGAATGKEAPLPALEREKVCHQFPPPIRQHAFRMELHTFDCVLAVAQAHDGAGAVFFGGPGADFQFCGKIFFFDDE